jgi:hypothetical protein
MLLLYVFDGFWSAEAIPNGRAEPATKTSSRLSSWQHLSSPKSTTGRELVAKFIVDDIIEEEARQHRLLSSDPHIKRSGGINHQPHQTRDENCLRVPQLWEPSAAASNEAVAIRVTCGGRWGTRTLDLSRVKAAL